MDNIKLCINVSSKKREKKLAVGIFFCNQFKKVPSKGFFCFDCWNKKTEEAAEIAANIKVIQWLCHSMNQGLISIMIKKEMNVTKPLSK